METRKDDSLRAVLETIHLNLTEIKTVADLSARTHFSSSYLHRLFKTQLNLTPHQYLTIRKMNRAKELLDNGGTILEACFQSGFDDYANFITLFRKHFGITPKKYQNTKNEKHSV